MTALAVVPAVVSSGPVEARVDAARAVERARYAFTVGPTRPFEEVYPSVFERRVAREIREERARADRFGVTVSRELLSKEYERIKRATKAPDQWAAIKRALGGERICKPSRRIHEVPQPSPSRGGPRGWSGFSAVIPERLPDEVASSRRVSNCRMSSGG